MFHKHDYMLINARYLQLAFGGTGNGDERFAMSTVIDGQCVKCRKIKTLTYPGMQMEAQAVKNLVTALGWTGAQRISVTSP